jgi:hypothetical protein
VGKIRDDIDRPSLDPGKDPGVEVLDLIRHTGMLASALTCHKAAHDAQRNAGRAVAPLRATAPLAADQPATASPTSA